ncbi:glycosyltransferase [Candidatus Sumerlaeota bacterium]|nr:glycosyltransferase [Candidatus Sumerlaeota bacterium]
MKTRSLVTTVLNEADTVEGLAEAVRSQTLAPDEWIVVDGGSTDGTPERLAQTSAARILRESGNIARGRNRAVAETGGRIVLVTDGGCRPGPRWVERLSAPIEAGRADVAAGSTRPRIERPFDAAQWVLLDQFLRPGASWRRPTISSRSLAFRRELWEKCPYPEWLDYGEDRQLVDAWIEKGAKIEFVEDADAAVEWAMRPNLATFLSQHYRYTTGDGQAGMRTGRNTMRICFYGGLFVLVAVSARWQNAAWVLALAIWLSYLAGTVVTRFGSAVRGRSAAFRFGTLLWLPLLLPLMDGAKISGYLSGLWKRLTDRSGEVAS